MFAFVRFLAAVLMLAGSWGAIETFRDRPSRYMPLRCLLVGGVVAASWWFSRI